ncbi:hypothetical protein [Pseudomonas sp. PS01303]|uniref:hypothetical protein n=1 Tax=Pseudomonas sp. PS01303 TaxID=2991439 RepID=UPI00249BEBC3|nr:hypothetical protein [Pseudomonas sp. PS01303]
MKIISSQRILRLANREEIHIPFGLSRLYKFALLESGANLTLDENKVVCIDVDNSKVQLYPYYCKAINIPRLPVLTFSIVVTERDKKSCAALISQVHYLSSPNKGIFFALKEREKIIACCILDTLNFGNPKGRFDIDSALYEAHGVNLENWGSVTTEVRKAVQKKLGLIWVSRIARAKEYVGFNIGTRLMEEMLQALPAILPVPMKHVEIIRTCGVAESQSHDFLEYAGFKKIKLRNQSTISFVTDGDLFPKGKPSVKLYYWRKLEGISSFEYARLFVPLSQEPFTWFAGNQKTWELRRSRGQFTENHIYQGRQVELRLGYNTNRKLWGVVNKVVVGKSIEAVLAEVGDFKSVIPIASSLEDAAKKAHSILGKLSESYIAFEITAIFNPDNLICHV